MAENKKILVIPADVWACGEFRVNIPYKAMPQGDETGLEFYVWDIVDRPQIMFPELSVFDAVLIQRPVHDVHVKLIPALQSVGVKVVVEIDDLLDWVHKDNVASSAFHHKSPALVNFMQCLKTADGVSISTPELAERYKFKNDARKIGVFYNCLDVKNPVYSEPSLRGNYPADDIHVMWSGSSSHWDSIKLLRGVIEPVIMQYDNVKLVIGGNKEFIDIFNLPEDRKIFIQGVPLAEYPKIPSIGDIFLNPVVQSPFNDAKSELKVLEAAIWKVPSISSPVAPYTRFNELSGGANLVVKGNKPIEWQKKIRYMIENEQVRKGMGQKSYEALSTHYNLDKENEKRIAFWKDILGV